MKHSRFIHIPVALATNNSKNWLYILSFALSIPSGASLLGKIYGLAQMNITVPYIVLPCCLGLLLLWIGACYGNWTSLATTLSIGFVSGLLGTFSYDLYRWPYQLAGFKIFTPIQVYGVWTLNAYCSSDFSNFVGWAYHFSNGVTFAIAYVIVAKKRHWLWAIAYALGLETIAVVTPFAQIFSLSGNYKSLFIAYSGQIAYGLPIGLMTWRWDSTAKWLSNIPAWVYEFLVGVSAVIVGGLFVSSLASVSGRSCKDKLVLNGSRIDPEIISINRDDPLSIYNDGEQVVQISINGQPQPLSIESKQTLTLTFNSTGIFQARVQTTSLTRSSFVIIEPIHTVRR
jgi:hypothetical protein